MTEYRHFRNRECDSVISLHEDEIGADTTVVNYEEVQVVPLDAVVIRREDLPEVTVRAEDGWFNAAGVAISRRLAHDAERRAAGYAAIARYLRENPPVDEAQVGALADLMKAVEESGRNRPRTEVEWIRDLVRHGVRVEL